MSHYEDIYKNSANNYDVLVSREDYERNLIKTLLEICSFKSSEVVEFGAGTGRLTQMLLPYVKSIIAFDNSESMLTIANKKLSESRYSNWLLKLADNRSIPVDNESSDITLAGWTFGHMTEWHPNVWKQEITKSIDEMFRILRPKGTAIIIETQGTGYESPFKARENLGLYYQCLIEEYKFSFKWIRTDYKFQSLDEAKQLTKFFFNKEFDFKPSADGSFILPECTGVWWRSSD